MSKIKVLSVFGTRPEAIKMAPLVRTMGESGELESLVCVTAQHREMLDQVLSAFSIEPHYDLNIMQPSQTLSTITIKALGGLEGVLEQAQPDLVLVHGDTSTTFAAALAAFYRRVPVGHVEAGLRSFDKYSPYPEEANRRLTGVLADLHFSPTRQNAENLRREGTTKNVFITGNTVIDALRTTVCEGYRFELDALNALDYQNRRIVLLTAHRRENYGKPMENIMAAVRQLAQRYPGALFVYPVHLSPYVQQTARDALSGLDNVLLIPPLGVLDMHNLMARCHLVMTDSGGLQEEAPALGKPVLVLRRETERPEAVAAGTVLLAGVEQADIVSAAARLFEDAAAYQAMSHAVNPYGDGNACRRITQDILYHFGRADAPAEDFFPR